MKRFLGIALSLSIISGEAIAKGRWFPFKPKNLKSHIATSNWTRMGEIPDATDVLELIQAKDGTIYASAICRDMRGRVFKSRDNCETWDSTATIPGDVLFIWSILEGEDGTLYIATSDSGKVFKSNSKGDSWIETGRLDKAISTLSLIEASSGILYAGTACIDEVGRVFKSENKGESWIEAAKLDSTWRIEVLFEASDGTLYAGTSINREEMIGRPLFKSTDGGNSWEITGNMGRAFTVSSIIESQDRTLYASVICLEVVDSETLYVGRVFKSKDKGESWEETQKLPQGKEMTWASALIQAFDGTLYLGMGLLEEEWVVYPKVLKSTDGGETWVDTGPLGVERMVNTLLETSDGNIYAGTGGYVLKYTPTGIEEKASPTLSKTLQVSPNPFKEFSVISFQFPVKDRIGLKIYDASGRLVKTFTKTQSQKPRTYSITWDGRDEKGIEVPPGVYFIQAKTPIGVEVEKILKIR